MGASQRATRQPLPCSWGLSLSQPHRGSGCGPSQQSVIEGKGTREDGGRGGTEDSNGGQAPRVLTAHLQQGAQVGCAWKQASRCPAGKSPRKPNGGKSPRVATPSCALSKLFSPASALLHRSARPCLPATPLPSLTHGSLPWPGVCTAQKTEGNKAPTRTPPSGPH